MVEVVPGDTFREFPGRLRRGHGDRCADLRKNPLVGRLNFPELATIESSSQYKQ